MKGIVLILLMLSSLVSVSQDIQFGRAMLDSLTSEELWGRGYTKNGMSKAAAFLERQFVSFGLLPKGTQGYAQPFSYSVNTFPGKVKLKLGKRELTPGVDFIVSPGSRGITCKGELMQVDSVQYIDAKNRVVLEWKDKLTWSVSSQVDDFTAIELNRKTVNGKIKSYDLDLENEFFDEFKAANICAYVPGTEKRDSFIFITAHYDHLGGMGASTYFPGANDNGSGISLLLNLARYYSRHPQRYSIAFICFAGEEIGLKGSEYFTTHPTVDLKSIRFLINTDLAGTGEEGISVVNATEFPREFQMMQKINDSMHLLSKINPRGKAANSDHYFFSEKSVPAFFFYTMGGIQAYHDVFDRPETLPMNEHEDLFTLVTTFISKLVEKK